MSGQTGSASTQAAERYASALFGLAVEAKAVEAVEADARAFLAANDASADLRKALASPLIPAEQKGAALAGIAARMKLSPLTANFFGVVARNGRADALAAMARAVVAMAAKARGAVVAQVATAEPMSDTQLADLTAALTRAFKAPVDVEASVKPELLGGLVVKIGSRLFDDSVKSKLDALKIAMKGA